MRHEHLPDPSRSLRHPVSPRRLVLQRAAGELIERPHRPRRSARSARWPEEAISNPAVSVDAPGHFAGQIEPERRASSYLPHGNRPEQPRLAAGGLGRFRHYRHLDQAEGRLPAAQRIRVRADVTGSSRRRGCRSHQGSQRSRCRISGVPIGLRAVAPVSCSPSVIQPGGVTRTNNGGAITERGQGFRPSGDIRPDVTLTLTSDIVTVHGLSCSAAVGVGSGPSGVHDVTSGIGGSSMWRARTGSLARAAVFLAFCGAANDGASVASRRPSGQDSRSCSVAQRPSPRLTSSALACVTAGDTLVIQTARIPARRTP